MLPLADKLTFLSFTRKTPANEKGRHLWGDGLSDFPLNSTVPSATAALLLLDAGKTHLVRQGGRRSDAQSGGENHRPHGRGRLKLSQALIHSHFISSTHVAVHGRSHNHCSVLSVLSVA
jgi:hypothetical protein